MNLILATDSYKVAHDRLDAPGTTNMQYHLIPRGGNYENIVVFGIRGLLKKFEGSVVSRRDVDYAEARINAHLGPGAFNRAKWEHIVSDHGGYLPVKINALPEGTIVKAGTPILTVEATCPKCFWLPGHLETMITRNIWYPTSVATRSRLMKKYLKKLRLECGAPVDGPTEGGLVFQLHDFGGRSYTSDESARTGGAAHLTQFWGTDTIDAVDYVYQTYGFEPSAFSVYAAEHSVRTTFGGPEGEEAYIEHMLQVVPNGIVSIVGDTFNIYNFTELLCTKYKDQIMKRGNICAPDGTVIQPGTVVLRPDSGEPRTIVPWMLRRLWESYGGTTNAAGFKVLDSHVRVIQGDGIKEHTLYPILASIMAAGFSIENVVFGCGTGLMQEGLTRDTLKWAYKGNWAIVGGVEVAMFKEPVTDKGKTSLKGYLNVGRTVFENGKIMVEESFPEIRERCKV